MATVKLATPAAGAPVFQSATDVVGPCRGAGTVVGMATEEIVDIAVEDKDRADLGRLAAHYGGSYSASCATIRVMAERRVARER